MFKFLDNPHPALPALCMMISVAAFSAMPVLFKIGGAEESPFLFTGIYLLNIGMGMGAAILLVIRNLQIKPEVQEKIIGDIVHHCKGWLMLASMFGSCGYVLFAFGLGFVDISIAAILYETSPLFLMFLMSFLDRGSERYDAISLSTFIFVILAIVGVALVVLSHNDTPQPLLAIRANLAEPRTSIGAIFVLAAAIGVALRVGCTLKVGEALAEEHSSSDNRNRAQVVFASIMTCICLSIAGGILCVFGLFSAETISLHQLSYAIISGFFITSIGTIALRAANLTTRDLGVNSLAFVTPLIALVWLWILSIVDVSHLDYLIIGAMGIVASNLLINAKADKRLAYNALVVSLWGFGTFVYFHDGYTTNVPLELPVTVFILVLSFRVDRLVRRTSQEESWIFEAFRRLELLAEKRQISGNEWKELLLTIDKHEKLQELTSAYGKLAKYLATQMKKASEPKGAKDEIAGIRHLVDNIAHSQQQGAHFGEIVAIALTGTLIVTGLMLFNGERDIYGEIISFVLSAVVVFLFFNILDLQKDRRGRVLKHGGREHDGEYVVKFDDKAISRKVQQWISVVTSAVIVLVFAWLFTWERVPF